MELSLPSHRPNTIQYTSAWTVTHLSDMILKGFCHTKNKLFCSLRWPAIWVKKSPLNQWHLPIIPYPPLVSCSPLLLSQTPGHYPLLIQPASQPTSLTPTTHSMDDKKARDHQVPTPGTTCCQTCIQLHALSYLRSLVGVSV